MTFIVVIDFKVFIIQQSIVIVTHEIPLPSTRQVRLQKNMSSFKIISKLKVLNIWLHPPLTLSSRLATFFKTTPDSKGGTVEIRKMVLAGSKGSGITLSSTGSL